MRGDPKYLLPGMALPVKGAGFMVRLVGLVLGWVFCLNPFFGNLRSDLKFFPSKETFEDSSLGRHELKL